VKRELTFSVICEENEVFTRTAFDETIGTKIEVEPLGKVRLKAVEVVEDGRKANITITWEGEDV